MVLKTYYPALYIAYCEHFEKTDELDSYIKACMTQEQGYALQYSQHIHGGILPTIERDRKQGKLETGRSL